MRGFRPGDRVYAYEFGNRQGGFYAEFAAAEAWHVARVPNALDLRSAGALATTGLTALQGLDALGLRRVDRLRRLLGRGSALRHVLALAGGPELERCLDFVQPRGLVVHPNGVEPAPRPRRTFRVRSYDAVADPGQFAKLARRIGRHGLRVPIAAVYPLARAADAHRRLERGRLVGRIVLRIRGRR